MKKSTGQSLKKHAQILGSKGGNAAAKTVDTKERASKAAKALWAKRAQQKKNL